MSEPATIIKTEKRHAIYTLAINKLEQDTYPYALCVAIQAAAYELYPTQARYYDPIVNGLELYPEIMFYKPAANKKALCWFDPADRLIRVRILNDAAYRTKPGTANKCIVCGSIFTAKDGIKTCDECFDAF